MKALARLPLLITLLVYGVPLVILGAGLWKLFSMLSLWKKDPQAFVNQYPQLGSVLGYWGNKTGSTRVQIPDATGAAGQAASDAAEYQAAARGTQTYYNEIMRLAALEHGFTRTLDIQGTMVWPWRTYQEWNAARTMQGAFGNLVWPRLPFENEYREQVGMAALAN